MNCTVAGCNRSAAHKDYGAAGLCSTHYQRLRRNGSVALRSLKQPRGVSNEERFWFWVDRGEEAECWPWRGALYRGGYGRLYLGKEDGRQIRVQAHRWSYEHFIGLIPESLLVLHHCDNPPCVNPAHLFLGTHKDNVADCAAKGRRAKPTAKLTPDLVRYVRDRYATGEETQRGLAKELGVGKTTIAYAVLGLTWAEV